MLRGIWFCDSALGGGVGGVIDLIGWRGIWYIDILWSRVEFCDSALGGVLINIIGWRVLCHIDIVGGDVE